MNPKDVYLPRNITNDNVCALVLAGLHFLFVAVPGKHNMLNFIVIIGYLGAHTARGGGGSRGSGLLPFFDTVPNCALKFLNQFGRNTLKNQFKKRKNPSKRCTNSIFLKFFNATLI